MARPPLAPSSDPSTQPLSSLYESDETAWLESMSRLAAEHRVEELDLENLSEYLADMARRDRREVVSCLTALLTHLLRWEYQTEQRSGGWKSTILEHRHELIDICESETLRNHARESLPLAFERARRLTAIETERELSTFPAVCPFTLEEILEEEASLDL